MEAVIWNILIILSILAAYKFSKKVGIGFSIFWIIWTVIQLWGPLQIIQLLGVGFSSYIGFNFSKNIAKKDKKIKEQDEEINELSAIISEFEKDKIRVDNENLNQTIDTMNPNDIITIDSNMKHVEYLSSALKKSQNQIIILSGWANSYVLNFDFREKLKIALSKGVNIYIGYGYKSYSENVLKQHEEQAKKDLKNLQEWTKTQETDGSLFINYYPTHSKILICDYDFAINGSFNWLSNSGGAQNDERSWIVSDKTFIQSESELIIHKIKAGNQNDFTKH
jgi:hypothetical protein|tara:strand:- start:239 stop:1078 length:840 start_codon:yes stop_codon:yes gene_type:complete